MRLVVSTAPEANAPTLARALLEERLAACVNILPGARSIYRWKGELCDDEECVLLIKTTADRARDLTARLLELHPYDVPEIISLKIEKTEGNPDYLNWLAGCVKDETI